MGTLQSKLSRRPPKQTGVHAEESDGLTSGDDLADLPSISRRKELRVMSFKLLQRRLLLLLLYAQVIHKSYLNHLPVLWIVCHHSNTTTGSIRVKH